MKSHKRFNRPSGLTYRLPGRAVTVQLGTEVVRGEVVRNIYAKPNLTRPSLCEVELRGGNRIIMPSTKVKVIA